MAKSKDSVLLSALDNYGGYPFDAIFDHVLPAYGPEEVVEAHKLSERVALVLWGGADISPALYGQKPNKYTGAGDVLSPRDVAEVMLAKTAIELGIPIIGICRGAQLMCALSGGSLIQHVQNHAGGYHTITTNDGRFINCPSVHHQMMYPWPMSDVAPGMEHEVIAWTNGRSRQYFGEPGEDGEPKLLEVPIELEIIWIPATKALCIQSHPEFVDNRKHPFVQYTLELTHKYILPEQA